MKLEDTPTGTLCSVGHPVNGDIVQKLSDGRWYYVNTDYEVTNIDTLYESLRALWIPGYRTKFIHPDDECIYC